MPGFAGNVDVDSKDSSAWAVVDEGQDRSVYKMHRRKASDDKGNRVSAQYNESPTVTALIAMAVSVIPQYTSHADFRRDWDIKGLQFINDMMKQGQLDRVPGYAEALEMARVQQEIEDLQARREQAKIIASGCEGLFNDYISARMYLKALGQLSTFTELCQQWEDLPDVHEHTQRLLRMRDRWEQVAHLVEM